MLKGKKITKLILGFCTVFAVLISFSCGSKSVNEKPASEIEVISADPQEIIVHEDDFESGATAWTPRGSAKTAISADTAQSGKQSLSVTGRTSTWNGPLLDMTGKLKSGSTYKISLYVYYQDGLDSQPFGMSIQRDLSGGATYTNIASVTVSKGKWTKFEAEYSVPGDEPSAPIYLYVETPYKADDQAAKDDLLSFYIDNVSVTTLGTAAVVSIQTDIPSLQSFYPDLPIGAAVRPSFLSSDNIHSGLVRHFGVLVYENEMKMDAMQPAEGNFNFKNADMLVEYAAKNGKTLRGHTLLWHSQVPAWFFQDPSDPAKDCSKEVLLKRIETHVSTIVSRYKGKVHSWDVVNEVIGDNGKMRDSKYYQIVGSDEYIAVAFRAARKADPDAVLIINDYGIDAAGGKQDIMYNLVKKLRAEGVPIDGVGLQAHISVDYPDVKAIKATIERFAALGLRVQVTELDMSIYKTDTEPKKVPTNEDLLDQAYKYRDLFAMFQEQARKGNLDMAVLWGLSDDETWLNDFPVAGRGNYPLFFGKNLEAKPAYWAIVDPSKLPIYLKKTEAFGVDSAPALNSPEWNYAAQKDILDKDGNSYGSFKQLWVSDGVYSLVTVKDSTKKANDAVVFYVDPSNTKAATRSSKVQEITVNRKDASSDDGKTYTILTKLSTNCEVGTEIGFDLKIINDKNEYSWNDLTNSQNKKTEYFGTIVCKLLPVQISARQGTPVIDGKADAIWADAEDIAITLKSEGKTKDGSTFKVLYDTKYIYVLVNVMDDVLNKANANAWEQDSIEIFIDQNNAKTKAYEGDDCQYRVSYVNEASFNGGCDPVLFKSAVSITSTGYMIEAAVPLTQVTGKAGASLGFDVQINDADASGKRAGVRNWACDTNQGYQNTSGFGVLVLE
ncbi:MAG TPA: endo-1,4-beta-xylanase [Treponemataceae bacterium]|nr:endo-1,4-beta-xylanase [Treponemataceae bacterium]